MRQYTLKSAQRPQAIRRYNAKNNQRKAVDVLTGITLGILADGSICAKESNFLANWLEHNAEDLPSIYIEKLTPFLLRSTAEEDIPDRLHDEFVNTLLDIIGSQPSSQNTKRQVTGHRIGTPANLIFDEVAPELVLIKENEFALSGEFLTGSRSKVKQLILKYGGGLTPQSPRNKTQYLVVGCKGSDQWTQSTLGSKIEKAMNMKSKGHTILIIKEEVLLAAIKLQNL